MEDPLAQEFVSWREKCKSTIRSTYQILSRGTPNLENETWNASANVINGTETPGGCRQAAAGRPRQLVRAAAEVDGSSAPIGRAGLRAARRAVTAGRRTPLLRRRTPAGIAEQSDRTDRSQHGRPRKPFRWHIVVFLAPAVLVYTAVMIMPLFAHAEPLAVPHASSGAQVFVGLDNFRTLFGDPRWSASFWNALGNNVWFFVIHMLVQNPIGVAAGRAAVQRRGCALRAFYRTAIFVPTILSFVIVGFVWKLILSPIWGVAPRHARRGRPEVRCSRPGSARRNTR